METTWLWFCKLVFRLLFACNQVIDAMFGILGIAYPTVATAMALLTVMVAMSVCMTGIILLLRAVAVELGAAGSCKHGVAVGRKKFCPRCTMETNAAEEIHARLREQRAERMRAQKG